MNRRLAHRRRVAAGALVAVALAAFALGAATGEDSAPPRPRLAETLPASQLAGQRIVAGFAGTTIPAEIERAIRRGGIAGLVLFADNLPDRAAGRRLIARLRAIPQPAALRSRPLLVMVDQEGGEVKRLDGAPGASAAQMGARGAGYSREQGRRAAANLRGVGIDVDLAPVLDVARPGGAIAATDRAFGTTAAAVAASAVPFAEGLEQGGVAATAKHFPGLGAAPENTDFAVQRLDLSRAELRAVDEAPYRDFIAAGGDLVMLSTAIYPALAPRPAAFVRSIATGELRRRLGFAGVSISDALDTVAVRAFGGPAAAALAGAGAGTDLLLYTEPGAARLARRTLIAHLRAGGRGRVRAEFERSAQRVLDLRARLGA